MRQVEQREYEFSPLAQVQQWSEVEAGRPLFESLLVFENYPVDPLLEAGQDLRINRVEAKEATNYPLTLIAAAGSKLHLRFLFDRSRFDDPWISRLEGHLARILEGLASGAEGRVVDLGLLTREEEHRLLSDWNETAAEYRREATLTDLFAEQVKGSPERVAVGAGGEERTYRELDVRSSQLGRYLKGLGVGPEVRVGVCLERTVDLPVALLAILKAGGAYVGLDPAYPAERLSFMVSDSGIEVLVTQEGLLGQLPGTDARVVCVDRDWSEVSRESGRPFESRVDLRIWPT